ncbi:MAG: hypothetical protein IPL61_23150 [Myxococcales bacterium]|nr:hypothetical protein [Myxococcales bacterium]
MTEEGAEALAGAGGLDAGVDRQHLGVAGQGRISSAAASVLVARADAFWV